ncbi:MAG: ankyrin repeat domain-containing protein [Lachnospiraceae bacterium]|nr:ankyrin repeat domain-containing protein [Lachnospiraceae bacterium]
MKVVKTFLAICGVVILCCLVMDLMHWPTKKLIHAIENNDIATVEKIVEIMPRCVNTYSQSVPERLVITVCQGIPGEYPLITACRYNHPQVIQCLIDAGADVNLQTPLHTALSVTYECKADNWYETSKYLIANGADLNYQVTYGSVLEDIVIRHDQTDGEEENVYKAFLYALENCDHDSVVWDDVLYRCVTYDRIQITQYLLDNRYCDVNASVTGLTMLMAAARDASPEMVQLLLDYGADKTIVNPDNGMTAYDYAVQFGNEENAVLLK